MKWLAVLLCVTQLSLQTLCCCSFQTTACHDLAASAAQPAQPEMPACHQAPPACHATNQTQAQPEAVTNDGTHLLKSACDCEKAQPSELVLVSSQTPEGPSVLWQLQPYAITVLKPLAACQNLSASTRIATLHPNIQDQGRSASRLCRFLI